jgi:hypothetical protein
VGLEQVRCRERRAGTRGPRKQRWLAEKFAYIYGKEIQRALDSEVAVGREISRSNSRVC